MTSVGQEEFGEISSDVDDAGSLWATLVPEVLVKIFGYLSSKNRIQAALVCRDWRDAVYVPVLWAKTDVRVRAERLTESTISWLADRRVRRVSVSDHRFLCSYAVNVLYL